MPSKTALICTGLLCLLAACKSEPPKARALAVAWVGSAGMTMRAELSPRSDIVAELKHAEKLEILQQRRRFVKVRNMGGAEGWLDGRNLLTTKEIEELRHMLDLAAKLSSQGSATVFDALNMHMIPNRSSPSPFQIPPGGSVDIVAHTIAERAPYLAKIFIELNPPKPPAPPRKPKKKGKKEKAPEYDPPPMPKAPGLPEDWVELSKTEEPEAPEPAGKGDRKKKGAPAAVTADDWYLVRLPDKTAGWVLSRMLVMSIPDEVATYAEGKRITSYFSLGKIRDTIKEKTKEGVQEKEVTKDHWVWTTLSERLSPFQYDGLRVFIYNARRHRYETAYRERDIVGFYPVLQHPVEILENRKKLTVPGFTVFTRDEDGRYWRRSFGLYGYRARSVGSREIPAIGDPLKPETALSLLRPGQSAESEPASIVDKVKGILKR